MALVQKIRKPDLIHHYDMQTHNGIEIKRQLKERQKIKDIPYLTTTVCRAKLQDLEDQMFNKVILWKVVTHVHVIEFQEKELPHTHMLIILKPKFNIRTPVNLKST